MINLPNDKGHPHNIVRWDAMIDTVNLRMEDLIASRYDKSALNRSNLFQLLDLILSHMDLDEVLPMVDDVDKYFDYFMPNNIRLTQLFSDQFSIRPTNNKFIINPSGAKATTEYILPTSRNNPIVTLPMGSSYEDWKNVRTVKMLYHNSSYLPSQYDFKLTFNIGQEPTYSISCIDVFALCLKFIKFYKNQPLQDIEVMRAEFIRKELRFLISDAFDIYLINLLKNCIFEKDIIEPGTNFSSSFKQSYLVLDESILDVYLNSFNSLDWFSTKWINKKSIIEKYNDININWSMEDFKANKAIEFLTYEPLLSMMLKLCSFQVGLGFSDKLLKSFGFYLDKMNSNKIWNLSNVKSLKTEIRSALEELT